MSSVPFPFRSSMYRPPSGVPFGRWLRSFLSLMRAGYASFSGDAYPYRNDGTPQGNPVDDGKERSWQETSRSTGRN